MILIVDNYDSFVHNLARYFRCLGQETLVLRNDDPRLLEVDQLDIRGLVIAPGPSTPQRSGFCLRLIEGSLERIPIIGVCLGHQAIVEVLGGTIVRANEPMHGRVTSIQHNAHPMFQCIPSPFEVCRYHSLVVDPTTFPQSSLEITARSPSGEIMAFAHCALPIFGVQFHPESILTDHGQKLLANVLQLCGFRACIESPVEVNAIGKIDSRGSVVS